MEQTTRSDREFQLSLTRCFSNKACSGNTKNKERHSTTMSYDVKFKTL